jgi:hypothetical protein
MTNCSVDSPQNVKSAGSWRCGTRWDRSRERPALPRLRSTRPTRRPAPRRHRPAWRLRVERREDLADGPSVIVGERAPLRSGASACMPWSVVRAGASGTGRRASRHRTSKKLIRRGASSGRSAPAIEQRGIDSRTQRPPPRQRHQDRYPRRVDRRPRRSPGVRISSAATTPETEGEHDVEELAAPPCHAMQPGREERREQR